MSVEQELFTGLVALYDADGAGTPLPELTGGVFIRGDGSGRDLGLPRLEFSSRVEPVGRAGTINEHNVRFTIAAVCPRDNAFGMGDSPDGVGLVDAILFRVDAVFSGKRITTGSWQFGSISPAVYQTGSPRAEGELVREAVFTTIAREGGYPLLNYDAVLTISGMQVYSWRPVRNAQELDVTRWNDPGYIRTAEGQRSVTYALEVSLDSGYSTIPDVGETLAGTFTPTGSSGLVTDLIIRSVVWDVDKRQLGQNQRLTLFCSSNDFDSGASYTRP